MPCLPKARRRRKPWPRRRPPLSPWRCPPPKLLRCRKLWRRGSAKQGQWQRPPEVVDEEQARPEDEVLEEHLPELLAHHEALGAAGARPAVTELPLWP